MPLPSALTLKIRKMPSILNPLNLQGATVGSSYHVDLSSTGYTNVLGNVLQQAHLVMLNESGCGLQCSFQPSHSMMYLAAGAWTNAVIPYGDNALDIQVIYVLPNAPVSQLLLTYYSPQEKTPEMLVLGNSPVGIGGTVQTSSVQTLSNEGNAANTLVIDLGDSAIADLVKWYNSGSIVWQVDQSGVAHYVIRVNNSGNPLQLGQAGDVTEVLGQLKIDQATSVASGGIAVTGGTSTDTLSTSSTSSFGGKVTISSGGMSVTGGTSTDSLSVSGTSSLDNGNITTDGSGDILLKGGKIGQSSYGDVIDASAGNASTNPAVYYKCPANGSVIIQTPSGTSIATFKNASPQFSVNNVSIQQGGSLSANYFFADGSKLATTHVWTCSNSTTGVTVSHGCPKAPQTSWAQCNSGSSYGSCTTGIGNVTSTTLLVTSGAILSGIYGNSMTYN